MHNKNRFIKTVTIAALVLASSIANAAMVEINPIANPFMFTNTAGKTLTFQYDDSATGTVVDKIVASDPITPQNAASVLGVLETTFGVSGLSLSSQVGSLGEVFSTTITSSQAYDYLAIHMGQYEVFFHFAALVAANSPFVVSTSGQGAGLSNYRAYNSGISEVPVPAAAFLFAPALLGFMGLRRKAKNSVA